MKNSCYKLLAFGLLALSFSCQREGLEPAADVVNYTVQLPETIATRADSYDGQVNQLLYEVYYKKGDAFERLYQQEAEIANGKVELPIEFVRDQEYKVLFWAQVKDNGVYETSSLTAVALQDNDALVANSDAFEAFYGTDEVTKGNVSANGGKVELTRAVSQLNIGTLPESLNVGKDNTVTLSKSSVTVKGLASIFNVMEEECGEIAEGATVSYASADVPTGGFSVKETAYTYVSKNYVGFAPKAATNVTVELAIVTNAGTINHIIPSVPVMPNYKTNIIGDLITASGDYSVSVGAEWGGDITPDYVNDWDEFRAAVSDGAYIVLNEDITYPSEYTLDKDVTIDLAGKSMKSATPALNFNIKSSSTIMNGTIEGKVYAQSGSPVLSDLSFGGTISKANSTEASLQIGPACNVTVVRCTFNSTQLSSEAANSTRPVSVQGRSSGKVRFEDCSFKSTAKQGQVYVNTLSGNAVVEFVKCNFNNKTPNIMLAADYPFENMRFEGTTKCNSVTLEMWQRTFTSITAEEEAYLKSMFANNSFTSFRFFTSDYTSGTKYIRK